MTAADQLSLLVMIICLLGSMFFSGSETAITSFGERRSRMIRDEGGRAGRAIGRWVDRPVFVLSTILLGNNIFNTLLGATATAMAIRLFEGGPNAAWAVPIAVLVSTGLLLIFGEIVPKAVGRIYSKQLMLPVMTVLNFFGQVTFPVTWLLSSLTELVIGRATRDSEGSGGVFDVTTGELDYLVQQGHAAGSIPSEQADLLRKIFRFDDKHVREIMVPVDQVTSVDINWELQRIRDVARRSGHSRLPVYERNLDNVRGVLHIKELVGVGKTGIDPDLLMQMVRPPLFVSESLLIQDLLRRFKEQRVHLAIVVDDAGDTVGVVTLEDVLEQIVGQIFDETDALPRHRPEESGGLQYVDGQVSLARVEETFDVEFGELDGVESVGDYLSRLAGQIPIAGSVFVAEGLRFKILAADAKHIIRVSVEEVDSGDEDDD